MTQRAHTVILLWLWMVGPILLWQLTAVAGEQVFYLDAVNQLAQFNSSRVGLRLFPKLGTVVQWQYWVDIHFTSLLEPNATHRGTDFFDDLNITYTQASSRLDVEIPLNTTQGTFFLTFETFNYTQNFTEFGKFFTVPSDTIKFSVRVVNDTALSTDGLRYINLVFTVSEPLVNYDNHYETLPYIRDIIFITNHFNVTLSQLLFADADGQEVRVSGTTSGFLTNGAAIIGVEAFIFSSWNHTWFFDPLLSIVLFGGDQTTSGGVGDGGGGGTNLLAIILPAVLAPVALCVVVTVIITVLIVGWFNRQRLRRAMGRDNPDSTVHF